MGKEVDTNDIPTDEHYFYFIPPDEADQSIALRRWFRQNMKTYYTLEEVVKHALTQIPSHFIDALNSIDYDHQHPASVFLLISIFSAYGMNEKQYPFLVDDSINETYKAVLSLMKEQVEAAKQDKTS
jgi:hypothetical protein